jgi:hypothetical protein
MCFKGAPTTTCIIQFSPNRTHRTWCCNWKIRRSRWPCGIRSAAAHLLKFWVRIPPMARISHVSVVCYQVEVSASGRSLFQISPTQCGVSVCDLDPLGGRCTIVKKWKIQNAWNTESDLHQESTNLPKI